MIATYTAGTDLLEDIFQTAGTSVEKVGEFFTTLFTKVVNAFWVSGTGLTTFGKLMLLPLSISAFYFAFKWIRSLIKIN